MPPLSLLVKPASSNCNLRCRYCFYHSLAENRQTRSYGVMDLATLGTVVRRALDFADETCTFAFQGGEPTLAGLTFYRALARLIEEHNGKRLRISRAIQTNGLMIDEEWAEFLAEQQYLVGLSLDGPRKVHDLNRFDASGEGSFVRVMRTADLLARYGVAFNILFVVNAEVARHADKVYRFFARSGFRYLQSIPCLDPLSATPGTQDYSLRPDRFTLFLKVFFDRWYEDFLRGQPISVRYFDNLVGMILGYPPEACGMSGRCACQFVIEADGGVYPCDFYVTDEWLLGNIRERGFAELLGTAKAGEFVDGSSHVDPGCRSCQWFALCRGGCRRMREPFADGLPALNRLCPSFKAFFDYAGERLCQVARMVADGAGRVGGPGTGEGTTRDAKGTPG